MSLLSASRLAVGWVEYVATFASAFGAASAALAVAAAAAASCRAMSVANVIVSSFLNIVLMLSACKECWVDCV